MMTKANHVLAFLAFLIYQATAAPITTTMTITPTASPTTSSISACTVSIPNRRSVLQDTACVQDAFNDMSVKILQKHIFDLPECSSSDILPKLNTQPWKVFQALKLNVELLADIHTSELNVSYSEYICRMRNVVLPFLEHTLNASCDCTGIECDSLSEEAPLPTSDDLKEYCIVSSIESILTNMVEKFADDKHVDFSSDDLQCRVDFKTRKQMQKIETSVNSYTRKIFSQTFSAPPCLLDANNFTNTKNHYTLACLQEMPAILRNTSSQELISLADDLQNVVPHFEVLLADLVSDNDTCPIDSDFLAMETEACIAQHLSNLYSSTLSVAKALSSLSLTCDSSSSTASVQGYIRRPFQPNRPTGTPAPPNNVPAQNLPTQPPTMPTTQSPAPTPKSGGYSLPGFAPSRPT